MVTIAGCTGEVRDEPAPLTRPDLVVLMRQLCEEAGAEHYLIFQAGFGPAAEYGRVLACNWSFDSLQAVGWGNVTRLVASRLATALGGRASFFTGADLGGILDAEAAGALARHGHRELACLRLKVGRTGFGVLLSASRPGAMCGDIVARAQMVCCYALSSIEAGLIGADDEPPLSERERECLRWVSEGKTTDEVALILGVSSNTVTGYVTQAMQKLSASNRAMAMATAIRHGLI